MKDRTYVALAYMSGILPIKKSLNISRPYISRIEKKALEKLRARFGE